MYVAVRRGPNWSLFMAAWILIALMTSVVLCFPAAKYADPAWPLLMVGRIFWYLAIGSLIAGTLVHRVGGASPASGPRPTARALAAG